MSENIFLYDTEDIDLKETSKVTLQACKQFDDIILSFNIFNDSTAIDLTQYSVDLRVLRSDNTFVIQDTGITKSTNNVRIECIRDITRVYGKTRCELRFVSSLSKQKTSFDFIIPIKPSVISENSVVSGNVVTATEELNKSIDIGNVLDDALKEDVAIGQPLLINLNTATSTGTTLNETLNDTIDIANTSKTNLETTTTNANNKKTELEGTISTANTSKTNLENATTTADAKKTELDTSIANAQDDINTINSAGNRTFTIPSTAWVGTEPNLSYILEHNLGGENLIVGVKENDTKLSSMPNYKYIDSMSIELYSRDKIDVTVTINKSAYTGSDSEWVSQEVIDARDGEVSLKSKIDGIDSQLADIEQQVPLKASQVDLDATNNLVSNKRDKSTEITMADLNTEVKTNMTGGSVAVVGINSTGKENVKLNSIDESKIDFITISSNNLINKNKMTSGGYYSGSGVWTTNASYKSSDFTEVIEGQSYIKNNELVATFWTDAYEFISSVTANSFTVPVNTKYVKLAFLASDTAPQLNKGSALLTYDDYKLSSNLLSINPEATELLATNIIKNGDMIGITEWQAGGGNGTLSAINNELVYTVSALSSSSRLEQASSISVVGHKYYLRGDIFPKYVNQTYLRIGGANSTDATELVANQWNTVSKVVTAIDNTMFRFYHSTGTNYALLDTIKFRKLLAIDLTAIYGIGNEPTLAEFNKILESYPNRIPNGWFDGTVNLFNAKEILTDLKSMSNGLINTNTENLFDKDTLSATGGYLNDTGAFVTNASYAVSDFIPVDEWAYYTQKTSSYVNYYDVNKARVNYTSGSIPNFMIPTNLGIKYIKVNVTLVNLETEMVVKDNALPSVYIPYNKTDFDNTKYKFNNYAKSKLYGKKWNAYGDSITKRGFGYHAIIGINVNGMVVRNYGLSGRSLASRPSDDSTYPPGVTDYVNMDDDADIISIFLGTNDFGSQVPLGNINSTTITEFYGALNILTLGLIEKFVGKKICFITPMQRAVSGDDTKTIPLISYVNAIKEIGSKFGIPVFDLYSNCGLYPKSSIINTTYFESGDGLHPNLDGHKIIAPRIQAFLESL